MTEREVGIEEARKILGPLADDIADSGDVVYLTRRGRRHVAIVPLDKIIPQISHSDPAVGATPDP